MEFKLPAKTCTLFADSVSKTIVRQSQSLRLLMVGKNLSTYYPEIGSRERPMDNRDVEGEMPNTPSGQLRPPTTQCLCVQENNLVHFCQRAALWACPED